ncbi:MAG: beta-aspartyl-peptidase [Bacillota bacterium]
MKEIPLQVTLIRNARIAAPAEEEPADLLVVGDKIVTVGRITSTAPEVLGDTEMVNLDGDYLVPGFIDGHVHLLGGGGEGGPATRTPEITLSAITQAGVTTVAGVLGTDATTRSLPSLVAKARGLEREGITVLVYTGAYQVPPPALTGSVRDDIVLFESIIGCKTAISDHRSSQPGAADLRHLASECRVGGMLGGKPGLLHVHVGRGPGGLAPLLDIIDNTEIPASQLYPTHVGRTPELLRQARDFNLAGGTVDLTAGERAADVLRFLWEAGADPRRITLSSDANGSLPRFDEGGNFLGLGVGSPQSLLLTVRDLVDSGASLADSLAPITENAARQLGLEGRKGIITRGADADLVCLAKDNLEIRHVWARGRMMIRDGTPTVLGTFEGNV